jgi:bifunctional lysine-specific demethylase and histidyl-hydroxylase NO66
MASTKPTRRRRRAFSTGMAGRPRTALERCTGHVEAFLADWWGQRPFHHRAGGLGFEDLLTFDDVDRMVSSFGLRTPAFRLVKDGASLPASSYTRSGRIGSTQVTGIADPARIFPLFADGATIVLQGVHRFWEPVARFGRDLESDLGHPTQVNAYITPPGSQGFAAHEDSHDVFVLQAFGSKQWEVWDQGVRTNGSDPPPIPRLSIDLQAGDCLYIPEGTTHAARTQKTISGHLTVGIHVKTWTDLVRDAFGRAEGEDAFRERMPARWHGSLGSLTAQTADRLGELRRWLEKLDPADLAGEMIEGFLLTRPPFLAGSLRGLMETGSVDDRTQVRRLPGSLCELAERDGRLLVYLGDRGLRMPLRALPAMRFLAERETFTVGDLAPFLDSPGRLALVRRLIREGLLTIEPPLDLQGVASRPLTENR